MSSTPVRNSLDIDGILSPSSWWMAEEEPLASKQEDSFSISSVSDPSSIWPSNNMHWEVLQAPSSCPGTPKQDSFTDESSVFSTPKHTSSKDLKGPSASIDLVTPEKLRTTIHLVRDGQLAFYSPMPKDKTKIDAGLQALHRMNPADRKRKAEELLERVYTQYAPDAEPNSVEFHKQAELTLQEEGISRTAKKIVRESSHILQKSPNRFIPLRHLTKLSKTGGFHLDYLGDTNYTPLAINPFGIRYVRVEDQKNSTLFPKDTTPEQIIQLAQTAEKIAREGNRSLRKTSEGYMIECCEKEEIAYSTIYPLFFYAEFSPGALYELTQNYSINSKEALQAATEPDAIISYRTYDHAGELEEVFVDVAPIFKENTGIDKGILMQFNRASAPDLFEFYEKSCPEIFYQS